jgi:hypothetical protein
VSGHHNVIKGFESLSKQQMFDMSARHVLKNGRASYKALKDHEGREMSSGTCVYSGIGCAAAPFLTPEARKKLIGRWEDGLVYGGLVPSYEAGFVQSLQDCHDNAKRTPPGTMKGDRDTLFLKDYRSRMRWLASVEGLNADVLEEMP